ncbi:MAG: tryptophan synthase subunit beta [Simkaniaceae bacterium]|nr:MAG: tryptophan synthase subunit beta [Simkaniaceae bacterium]
MTRRYGAYGGAFIPEVLAQPIKELEEMWNSLKEHQAFLSEFHAILKNYAGRPTPLTPVPSFSKAIDGPKIYLKREDLLHTGAHKLNNTLGQCLIAKRMGKKRVIAETGAGQHGVATATACAFMGLECVVYMGKKDALRQEPNVKRMKLLGAEVIAVDKGAKTLKDAINEAMRDWSKNYEGSHYCLGSALGPHPYPEMVAFFQKVIGEEVAEEMTPDVVIACIGGGSNAIGIFSSFIGKAKLIGVEGGGKSSKLGENAARFSGGKPGILHGTYTYLLQDNEGQIVETSSISAGLDYPAIGPMHADLHDQGQVEYTSATDKEVLEAFKLLSKSEGIIPALESAHALAYLVREAKKFPKETAIVVNLSGRGDKDLPELFAKGLIT